MSAKFRCSLKLGNALLLLFWESQQDLSVPMVKGSVKTLTFIPKRIVSDEKKTRKMRILTAHLLPDLAPNTDHGSVEGVLLEEGQNTDFGSLTFNSNDFFDFFNLHKNLWVIHVAFTLDVGDNFNGLFPSILLGQPTWDSGRMRVPRRRMKPGTICRPQAVLKAAG